jgi:putative FmdB family regulatory protein
MPYYEYQCKECHALENHFQKMTDRKKRKCQACGKPALERLIGAPAVIFKGPGFYENDYKKKS